MTSGDSASRPGDVQDRLGYEQILSDTEQTLSDTDQTLSDMDQTLSDTDQRAAENDQAVSDREHDDRGSADDAGYETSRAVRQRSADARTGNAIERLEGATARDEAGSRRDIAAARRDAAAVLQDAELEALEHRMGTTECPVSGSHRRCDALFELQRQVRARAAADRARAAADRAQAARDRDAIFAELHKARLDELTGAHGRTAGRHELAHELERARRSDGVLVLAFVDVDRLKVINDRGGHSAGDAVLRAVVDTIRRNLRPYDPIVRWGGDEFVAALGGTNLREAEQRFDQIRDELSEREPTTITFGLAAWDGSEDLDRLVARADAQLISKRRRPQPQRRMLTRPRDVARTTGSHPARRSAPRRVSQAGG